MLDSVAGKVRLVRKLRRLPLPGEVLVSPGEAVEPDTPVAKIALRPGIPWVIPGARLLGIEPEFLSRAMLRAVGDKVKAKEVFARVQQGLYGRKELESPVDGTIEDVSDRSGRITVREEFGREDPPVEVDVAFELQCKPDEVRKYMLRQIGQEVKKDQMIAKKGEAQAFFSKTALSPISGVVSRIDPKTGRVTISRPFKQVVVKAYLKGQVASVVPGRGCVVETPGIRLTGVFGLGRETHGPIRVLAQGPDRPLLPDMIGEDCKGAIIVGGSCAAPEALQRALQAGVKGVISGTVSYLTLTESLGVRLGVGITGQEDTDLTVVLTEGFGRLPMRDSTWKTLTLLEGRQASLNGATQIRAGAIRPEIVVPFPEYAGAESEGPPVSEDLRAGMAVRIVAEPYFGATGTIIDISRQPVALETETRVPVVRVALADGQAVTVARANVEVL